MVGILPEALRGRDDLTFDEVFPLVRGEAIQLSFKGCSWFSTYRIHHRRAARFRAGRCFLLGDAAHIHSPVGAQGTNTGLQDAYNLGWKLALVVSGAADAACSTPTRTSAFRSPAASSRRPTGCFDSSSPTARWSGFFDGPSKGLALAMGVEELSQARVSHDLPDGHPLPRQPAVGSAAGPGGGRPASGRSFSLVAAPLSAGGATEDLYGKLDDTRFTHRDRAARPYGGIARPRRPAAHPGDSRGSRDDRELARARIPKPPFYLIRPDGHVGLSGPRLDAGAVTRYLSGRLIFGTSSNPAPGPLHL